MNTHRSLASAHESLILIWKLVAECHCKKKDKMDIFIDDFLDFEKGYQNPGSTFYIRIVKGFCV